MKARILYVEDDPQNMHLICKILRHEDFDVLEAINGLTGVNLALKEKPDLILMDINLPDIDGLEATARIKANPELRLIPVVALTANAMLGDKERALAAGCDDYVTKPFNHTVLVERLNQLLNIAD